MKDILDIIYYIFIAVTYPIAKAEKPGTKKYGYYMSICVIIAIISMISNIGWRTPIVLIVGFLVLLPLSLLVGRI